MKLNREIFFLGFVTTLFTSTSFAATRTVQFSGIAAGGAGGLAIQPTVVNHIASAECQVVVINTGLKPQIITDFKWWYTDSAGANMFKSVPESNTGYRDCLIGSSSDTCKPCLNATLNEGNMCVFWFATNNIVSGTSRSGVCAGTIKVKDSSEPGSVVASGAISVNQEALVLGGVLSGAYYASGTHVKGGENTLPALIDGAAPAFVDTVNMNIFCYNACSTTGTGGIACEEQCGKGPGNVFNTTGRVSHYSGIQTPASDGRSWVAIPRIDDNTSNVSFDDAKLPPVTGPLILETCLWTDPLSGTCQIYGKKSFINFSSTNSEKPWITTANPHWAGGMVYEFEMGAKNAICSANADYTAYGGLPVRHDDTGLSDDAIVKKTNADTNPPEALYCAHRHGNSDLHMRVGSSTSFPINGGMAF